MKDSFPGYGVSIMVINTQFSFPTLNSLIICPKESSKSLRKAYLKEKVKKRNRAKIYSKMRKKVNGKHRQKVENIARKQGQTVDREVKVAKG